MTKLKSTSHLTLTPARERFRAVQRLLACAVLCVGVSGLSSCSSVGSGNPRVTAPIANVSSEPPVSNTPPGAQGDPTTVACWESYVNKVFGYSVKIPAGLPTSSVPSPPIQQHGVTITLPSGSSQVQPSAYLSVEGNFNVQLWSSIDEAIDQNIEWTREKVSQLEVLRREPTRLHDLPATHVTLRSRSRPSGEVIAKDLVLAIREVKGEVGIVYTISLSTPEGSYDRDKEVFDRVVESWRARRPFE